MDEKNIEELKQQCTEYLDGWKRAKADFLNYKKEEAERMQIMGELVKRKLLLRILPILDNLKRAEKEIPETEKQNQFYQGFLQIVSQWQDFLKSEGIEEIETIGKEFDPQVHEAVGETEGDAPATIQEEVEKGYTIHGKLLRPAKVKVVK